MTDRNKKSKKVFGFTIVELVICIAVVAILAAVSIVAYRGVQERARDTQRMADVQHINDAIQIYILNNKRAPYFGTECPVVANTNNGMCIATDVKNGSFYAHWTTLQNELRPYYENDLPTDPCGVRCYKKGAGAENNRGIYSYVYYAPGSFPNYNGQTPAPTNTSYAIFAQNLEAKTATFGYGFGSF